MATEQNKYSADNPAPGVSEEDVATYLNLTARYNEIENVLYSIVTDQANMSSAKGGFYNQFQNNLRNIDRFGNRIMSSTTELSGLTFITRPKLNLATANLKNDATLILLNSKLPKSIAFMIRMLLDTKLSKSSAYHPLVSASPFLDENSPWLTPVMNNLTDITGFPDPTMDVYTSEGGYFGEDISFAAGSDEGRKTYELTMSFNDIQNGPILALFQFWFHWIALLTKGAVMPYYEDIEQNRLPYTVSIYRFMFDPTRRFITRWSKSTGCFPRAIPLGSVFDKSFGEPFRSSAAKFSIPFVCNVFEPNKTTILQEFNMLSKRYCPSIDDDGVYVYDARPIPEQNYMGLPFIINTPRGFKMVFKYKPDMNPNYQIRFLESTTEELAKTSMKIEDIHNKYRQSLYTTIPQYASSSADGDVHAT